MNFWESFSVGVVLNFIKAAIKNPTLAANVKMIFLEIRNDINTLYPGE